MKKRIFRITILLIIVAGIFYFNGGLNFLQQNSTAFAVGDLTIDWGVPDSNPIFVVNNFAPGEVETRTVTASNSATSSRPVGVRGTLKSQTKDLDTALDFVIKDGSTDVYGGASGTGPKTLADFFAESASMSGVSLSILAPGATTHYSFMVSFDKSAGNEFQRGNLVFDLTIGIFFELPEACKNMHFSGPPIFGTSGNDHIRGTNGNDLIIGFEGNDVVDGGNGNDCIVEGDGNNQIHGGNGSDVIVAGNGNNKIFGGNGNDVITSGNGNNFIDGENGDDDIKVGNGNNNIDGGNGDDKIMAGNGDNTIEGGNGKDQITAGTGANKVKGGNGNDTITVGSIKSTVDGGNGMDMCVGGVQINCEL